MNMTEDMTQRSPAVAGRFYPAEAEPLRAMVEACLDQGLIGRRQRGSAARAIISPHAGYAYSGWLAGAAWRSTARVQRSHAVILSPSHRHAFDGIALPSERAYLMPGFKVKIDREARWALVDEGLAHVEDAAHDAEHGIETQLPFLHRLHPGAQVVPLVIGRASVEQVARVVDFLARFRDKPPLFVLSSDLSHFLSRDAAEARDLDTARLIELGRYDQLTDENACGAMAITGYMASDYGRDARAYRLALANSHAVTRDDRRTVGYGAWALFGAADAMLPPRHRAALLKVARDALRIRARKGKMPGLKEETFAQPLRGYGATFVTLTKGGQLRGCIGSLSPSVSLLRDVATNAIKAGFEDSRFDPVTTEELGNLKIKIALLTRPERMHVATEAELLGQLVPGQDGLILSDGDRRGTFLPMVWDSLETPEAFFSGLKVKAGLPRDHWSDTLRVERFRAESFAES